MLKLERRSEEETTSEPSARTGDDLEPRAAGESASALILGVSSVTGTAALQSLVVKSQGRAGHHRSLPPVTREVDKDMPHHDDSIGAAFDVEILHICRRAPSADARLFAGAPLDHAFWSRVGFAGANLSFPDARLLAAALRAADGAAMIVPSAYRTSMIPIMAARRIAEQRLEVMRLRRGTLDVVPVLRRLLGAPRRRH